MKNLLAGANESLGRQSRVLLILLGLIQVGLVGIADYMTGTELSLSIFYLLPISLITWLVNRSTGSVFSIISVGVELATDIIVGHPSSHSLVLYWNHAVHLGFFLIVVFILSVLRMEYIKTVKLNVDLRDTLVELKSTKDELERKAHDLARSNMELEQFASVAAHDLKGPVIVAGAYIHRLQRLYKHKLGADADRIIGYINDGLVRMEALINALLTYARVGTTPEGLKTTNVNDLVDLAAANLRVDIEESYASVTHDPLPTLRVDAIQMVQLFQNLISNGIKFCRGKTPHVHISGERKGKAWVFSISDNGIGIELENMSSIFNIFRRLNSGSEFQGSGIGLATCKKIVEYHRGRIWVESAPGKGSTFYFTIPTEEDAQA